MTPSAPARTWRADLALTVNTLIWGSTFVVVKQALEDSSTVLFLALRFSLATVALGIAFRPLSGKLAHGKALLAGGVLAGVFLYSGYLFQTVGLRYTTPSKSAFITGLTVVFVPILAAVVRRQVPHAWEIVGVVVATAGMALLTLPGHSFQMQKGDLLTLACAAAFAAHVIVVGHYSPKLGFQGLTLIQIATSALLALASFWWVETPAIRWTPRVATALLVTGLLATALAFAVQSWAQQHTSPTRTALIFSLEPVFAWATSFLLTGELLTRAGTIGAALILAGILLVELKPARAAGHPAQ